MTEFQAWLLVIATILLVIATAATAAVAFLFGRRTINANRKIARQRASIDFIETHTSDPITPAGFRAMRKRRDGKIPPADAENEEERSERRAILSVLNRFEILAIGLKNGIYDEKIIWDYFQRDLREMYLAAEKIILAFRGENDPDAFCEFENLAKRVKISASLGAN